VLSPLLMNVALHGMEQAAGVRYHAAGHRDAGSAVPGSPVLIRYADDLLALCHSRQQAEQVKARLAAWLAPRGLAFNKDKTRVVHLDQGVDFLGFNIRRYHGKLLIKPSKAAVKRVRERLAAEMRALRGANAQAVLIRLTRSSGAGRPTTGTWCPAARSTTWTTTCGSSPTSGPSIATRTSTKRWITARYFGAFNPSRRDRWVFGDRDSGAYLLKVAWTRIVRHTLVKGWASPDDPVLAGYWAARQRRSTPPLDRAGSRLLVAQRGRCPLCGGLLLHADREPQTPAEWEQWLKTVHKATRHQAITAKRRAARSGEYATLHLVHTHCRRRLPNDTGSGPALLAANEPAGLA
jgi:RNA-directed DNA polymerase